MHPGALKGAFAPGQRRAAHQRGGQSQRPHRPAPIQREAPHPRIGDQQDQNRHRGGQARPGQGPRRTAFQQQAGRGMDQRQSQRQAEKGP